jgi:hypothetical protein
VTKTPDTIVVVVMAALLGLGVPAAKAERDRGGLALPASKAGSSDSTLRTAMPSAAEFAHAFVGLANGFAQANGDFARIAHVDCVQGSSGHYMCSYALTRPGRIDECHLMQARWTPDQASTITVTLAGRTRRCESLRGALRSLN